ncbi:hypothetical protein VIGAN_09040000 [Vigna angularis var. angularis]|uniref:Uncharacterized protein n=1 Tax=Vigna angularis var. angularis TaxID=157739 RepID=A0A0S3SW16_PHAAN|nr:hypothetical protein VIGAN_09040000 [Vigna angularis var. angularis]
MVFPKVGWSARLERRRSLKLLVAHIKEKEDELEKKNRTWHSLCSIFHYWIPLILNGDACPNYMPMAIFSFWVSIFLGLVVSLRIFVGKFTEMNQKPFFSSFVLTIQNSRGCIPFVYPCLLSLFSFFELYVYHIF